MREDWIQSSLEDLSDYEIGGDWGKDPELVDENFIDIYCIRGSEFRNWQRDKGSTASHRKVKINSFNSRKLLLNDILVEISGGGPDQPVGRTVIIDNEVLSHFKGKNLMFTNFLRLVRPNHLVNSIYINQYLKYFYSTGEIVKYQAGSNNLRNLKFGDFMKIKFPLPPLPEQRAIVKKLESLFSSLDAGVADLKKAQQQLKIYRQAVLKKAFEGELTKEWRNIEEKNFAVEEILNQIEEEREKFYYSQVKHWNQSVKDWENSGKEGKKNDKPTFNKIKIDATEKLLSGSYVHFGSICNVVRGGSPRPAGDPEFYDGNIPFLKVADLTRISSKFVTEYAYTIKPAGLQKTRFLKKGTLVISNSGATLGVARILGIDATANDGIAAFLDLHPEMTEFYYYYLNSQTENLRAIDQGAGQPNLNTDLLKELLVPIFSIEEQHQIVKQIESRLSVCDSIEQNIKESLVKAEALRQSILKKAFEGNLLTVQELAECKLAADYEPSGVLLERIKAEQNQVMKPNKKLKTKAKK